MPYVKFEPMTKKTADSLVEWLYPQLQDESYFSFMDMLLLDLPKPKRIKTPLLVLGGEYDAIFPRHEVEKTAVAYNCTPHDYYLGFISLV